MTKTTRVMLAVLAACGATAALAESSVTIYGRVNTTFERQKTGNNTTTGLFDNSSRIGFKGTEDLGGGLKANFALETGFNSDDGKGSSDSGGMDFTRWAEVNLEGTWGMVRLGQVDVESYYATSDYIGMHNHETGSSADALYDFSLFANSNRISYRTPTISGLWAEVGVGVDEKAKAEDRRSAHNYDLAANYEAGPLGLGFGYTQQNNADKGTDKQLGLRASYSVGQFTFGAYYQRSDLQDKGTRNNYRVAAKYEIGASEFHLNVGQAAKWSKVDDSKATQYTIGYNYNLSKRTKLYTYYTKVNNSKGADYKTKVAGQDFSSFALGIRHNF